MAKRWWMGEMKRPLVNDDLFREELARIEAEGAAPIPPPVSHGDGTFPPASGDAVPRPDPWSESVGLEEIERLRQLVRSHGIELINDGASYRAKRQRDFMIWTLETSPLESEARGGGEPNALWEIYCRFINPEAKS